MHFLSLSYEVHQRECEAREASVRSFFSLVAQAGRLFLILYSSLL